MTPLMQQKHLSKGYVRKGLGQIDLAARIYYEHHGDQSVQTL